VCCVPKVEAVCAMMECTSVCLGVKCCMCECFVVNVYVYGGGIKYIYRSALSGESRVCGHV
jgi:hypothetical protein